MGKYTGKAYRPSNGTEGMYFTEEYCMNCLHCDPNVWVIDFKRTGKPKDFY